MLLEKKLFFSVFFLLNKNTFFLLKDWPNILTLEKNIFDPKKILLALKNMAKQTIIPVINSSIERFLRKNKNYEETNKTTNCVISVLKRGFMRQHVWYMGTKTMAKEWKFKNIAISLTTCLKDTVEIYKVIQKWTLINKMITGRSSC